MGSLGRSFVSCLLLLTAGCASGSKFLNTTCSDVQFEVNIDGEISLIAQSGTTIRLQVNQVPEKTHLTLNHFTEFSRDELSFHQIGEGSRVIHEFGIGVFHGDNFTWNIRFEDDDPKFTGYYEISIGECTSEENLTAVARIFRDSGKVYNLSVPELAIPSLKLYCPFRSSYFILKVFHNVTEVKQTDVYFDSPRKDLFFLPNQISNFGISSHEEYECSAQNSVEFEKIDYLLNIDTAEVLFNDSRRHREGDDIEIDLASICLPFSSKFVTVSDSGEDVNTITSQAPPQVSFSLNNKPIAESNLTLAQLSQNGSYSCHVSHVFYESHVKILELYVRPLNVCAHSNGGCEHLCSTDIIADTFNCSCRSGYQLESDSRGCEDVNECLSPSQHTCSLPSERCRNEPVGSYSCDCADGYLLNESTRVCADVDECLSENGDCLHQCVNTPGSYVCECRFGYTLLPIDNRTCIDLESGGLETPPSLVTPIILALIFGAILLLSIITIGLLLIAVCKRNRTPTRLKYDMFTKRLSGDFKCHQQVDNPAFRLDQSNVFAKRISPRKNIASYDILKETDFPPESKDPKSLSKLRPRSLEQAALSEGAITEIDYLSDDVMLPKPISTDPSPSTLPKFASTQGKEPGSSPNPRRTKHLPHSNMVPVLPTFGGTFVTRNVKSGSYHSDQDSHISSDIKIDQTFC